VISWPSASIIGIEHNKISEAHADSRSPQSGIPAREVAREEAGAVGGDIVALRLSRGTDLRMKCVNKRYLVIRHEQMDDSTENPHNW